MPLPSPLLAIAALALVLALIWAIQRALCAGLLSKMIPPPAPGGRLRVLQVLALDSRRQLHLVQCGGRDVLLLTSANGDRVVGWLDRSPAA